VTLAAIPWDFALILAVLGILVPWRGKVRVQRLLQIPNPGASGRLWLYGSTICFQWVTAGFVYWRALARGIPYADLGLAIPDPWRAVWIAGAATFFLCAIQVAGLRKMVQLPAEKRGPLFRITEKIMPRTWTEAAAFTALACTAGVSEEFLYRGFVFAIFAKIFVHGAEAGLFAGVVSSLWFAIAHLYQGKRGVITTFVVGMIFAGLRSWSGTLLPSMLAHAAVDLLVGLYVPRLLARPEAHVESH
jgi:membrane protease YdiL (CAAX protease family)